MSPALHRGIRKALRTVLQLAAGGGLTALISAVAGGLAPQTQAIVMAAWTVLVTLIQVTAETAGKIPTLLPAPGIVPSAAPLVSTAVGTVETTVDQTGGLVGDIEGTVEGLSGELLGEVGPPGEAVPDA